MNLSWDSLKISEHLVSVIKSEFSFECMTAVQSATIPIFVANKDVAVEAVTGSGKTLAFIVPILEILNKKWRNETFGAHDVSAIIVSPTRELATQTFAVLNTFIGNESYLSESVAKLSSLLLIGGTSAQQDIDRYLTDGCHIIVSTPGRLFDLLEKCNPLSNKVRKCLEVFVLDEADQLLSLGFDHVLNAILSYLPKQRRTGLFSATQTKKLDHLIRAGLRNPVRIEIKEKNANQLSGVTECLQMPLTLTNSYYLLNSWEHKLSAIVQFIRQAIDAKYIIFMSTCAQVNYFERPIGKYVKNIPIFKLHRKLRKKRQKIFEEFKESPNGIMICTDVMSRGIDIPRVDWVIHFDLPNTVESYVHRCGRSGHQVGVNGNSMIVAVNDEIEFVKTCQSKGIELNPMNVDIDTVLTKSIIDYMRQESRRDGLYYELGMQAFVSFIRTYSSKHCMSTILYKKLDFNDLANGYALLKKPFMPEMKFKKKSNTFFSATLADKTIANKHKHDNYRSKRANNESYNQKIELKRKLNKNSVLIKNTKLKGKRKKEFINEIEMLELESDAKMVKKLKKGKISSKEFDDYFGL